MCLGGDVSAENFFQRLCANIHTYVCVCVFTYSKYVCRLYRRKVRFSTCFFLSFSLRSAFAENIASTSIIRRRRLPFMTIVVFRALCSDNVFRRKIPSPSGVPFDGRRNSAVHVQRRTTRVAGRALSIPRAVNVKTINVRVSDHFLPANSANFSSVRQSRTAFISVINIRQNFSFRGRKIRIHFHNLDTSLTIRGICPSSPTICHRVCIHH